MEQKSKVVASLNELGVNVNNIWDLVDMPSSSYIQAIPILITFLDDESLSFIELEGVVRSLLVKAARFRYNDAIFRVFYRVPLEKTDSLRWICGYAIYDSPRPQDFDKIYEIVKDKKFSNSRQGFIKALGKLKDMRAEGLLVELLDQEDVQGHTISALGILKSKIAKSKIESFLNHPNKFLQRQAKTALKRIG